MKSNRFADSVVVTCFNVFGKRDKIKILFVLVVQVLLSILDLIGVALVGVVGALAVRGVSSQKPGDRVSELLNFFSLSEFTYQKQIVIIGLFSALFLISRTLLSAYFTYRSLIFLSKKSAQLTSDLLNKLLAQPILKIKQKTSAETLYALTDGVRTVTLEILGSIIILISDISLLLVMAIGLLYVDTVIALTTFIIFGSISYLLYRLMHLRAIGHGKNVSEMSIKSNEKILEILNSYREAFVRNRRFHYSREIEKIRSKFYISNAEIQFLPSLSKYIIEASVVLGAISIGFVQFSTQDSSRAIANLLIFMAAGSRIAPALLRVQQSAVALNVAQGRAKPALSLISDLKNSQYLLPETDVRSFNHKDFSPEVVIDNISFKYPGSDSYAINNINLVIKPGTTTAIVGTSGAGKTTLVDILLGVLSPTSGSVSISGFKPSDAITKWSGAIGYVPQQTFILNGTIADNIKMGFQSISNETDQAKVALSLSHLSDFVYSLPNGINESVGDGGARLSGGQKQRLGIARALFTSPLLLVLDEATSSLDGVTEADISNSIKELKGSVTVILIAHRLSTVRSVDKVVFLDKGEIVAEGSFDEVRKKSPDFDRQASLMGL
jgi:ABC-type multidrug transport system fused ATPase/permease subunit